MGTTVAATANQTWTLTGKLATVSDPRNATWLTTYAYGICCDRVTSVQDALGFLTQFGYDGVGNRTSVTDPNGSLTTTTYDAVGRIVKRVDGVGKIWLTTYDDDLTDGVGLDAAVPGLATGLGFGPGARGSALQTMDPTGVSQMEVRDGLGRTVRRVDGASRVTTSAFAFGADRLETVTTTNALGHATIVRMDGAGQVRSVTTAAATATRSYDARGLLLEERDANQVARTLTYDAQGRMVSEVAASGVVTGKKWK